MKCSIFGMGRFYAAIKLMRGNSKGATIIEYVLIASLIGLVLIIGMKLIGNRSLNMINNIVNSMGE